MIVRRRRAERRRQQIVAGLDALHLEVIDHPVAASHVRDMLLYAEIGKERLSLPDDYVAQTRESARRFCYPLTGRPT